MHNSLFEEINKEGIEIYSFDVFDTVLARTTANPEGVFAIMSDVINQNNEYAEFPNSLKIDFYWLRKSYEHLARRRNLFTEICLDDIYSELSKDYNLSEEQIYKLIELEKEIEYNLSIGITKTIDTIKKLLETNKKVILISDMYLSEDDIKKMLIKADIVFNRIKLYVSSNCQAKKSDGKLFDFVKNAENLMYNKWMHIGDNEKSDHIIPKKKGIQTYLVKSFESDSFGKYMSTKFEGNSIAEIYIGISKYLNSEEKTNNFYIGSTFGAPLFLSYVQWILEQSLSKKIKTLFFLSRDGYILKKIADKIILEKDLRITTRYFYGSRDAIRYKNKNEECLLKDYLLQNIDLTKTNFAMVDVFGTGRTLDYLAKLVHKYTNKQLTTFYYRNDRLEKLNFVDVLCYTKNIDVWNNIELFCKSMDGQVIKYEKKGMLIEPQFNVDEEVAIHQFGLQEYFDGVDRFVDLYLDLERNYSCSICSLNLLREYVEFINKFPNNKLIRFMDTFPKYPVKVRESNQILRFFKKNEINFKKLKYILKLLEQEKIIRLLYRK